LKAIIVIQGTPIPDFFLKQDSGINLREGWMVHFEVTASRRFLRGKFFSSSSSSSDHEVRPINDLFQPHDCICPAVSLIGHPGLHLSIGR
jgi:hypothetical protein